MLQFTLKRSHSSWQPGGQATGGSSQARMTVTLPNARRWPCVGEQKDQPVSQVHTDGRPTLYTIGHSNHPADELAALLLRHDIQLVLDVRSSPYSRYVPQANREPLVRTLAHYRIAYRWLGDRLGGRAEGGMADYDKLRASPAFQQGIAELITVAAATRAAILCAEGDHRQCHRYTLITPALLENGVHVLHIQPDGTLVDEDSEPTQLALF
jgi:uncharacterized protein (DUF488 family)